MMATRRSAQPGSGSTIASKPSTPRSSASPTPQGPPELPRLHALLARGLTTTAPLWPEIRTAYRWVHQAAHLLTNAAGHDLFALRHAYRGPLAEMGHERTTVGALAPAVEHFRTVTEW